MAEPISVETAYKAGLEYLPYDAPPGPIIVRQTVKGASDGPCELLFRRLEMLPIDDLDRKSAYQIGVAVRFAGYLLDLGNQDVNIAMRRHGELAEATHAHMERFRAGTHGPYSYETFVSDFLSLCRFDEDESTIRGMFAAYISNALEQKICPIPENPGQLTPIYVHPDIEAACKNLLGQVQVLHIDSSVYDACEISDWYAGGPRPVWGAFQIVVDAPTWPNLVNDPTIQAQTEFLLVDAREEVWRLYERIAYRGVGVHTGATEVTGVIFNSLTGDYQAIESNSVYAPKDGSHQPWVIDPIQQDRVVRVLLTVLLLMQSEKVTVRPDPQQPKHPGSWNLELPKGSSVNDIVAEVLENTKSPMAAE